MTTSRGQPTARASRPGRAVEAGRDGPWRVVGRPRPQPLVTEEAGGDAGLPIDTEAARAKLETRARAARRRRKLEKEAAASLRWALFLWASAGFAWAALVTLAYKVAKDHLPFALALSAALTLLLGAPVASSIPVYDCEHPATTYRAINLHEPHDCPDPETDYLDPVTRTLHVLQVDHRVPVQGYKCHVVVNKEVTRCGFNSITYGAQWPTWNEVKELTPKECRLAMKTGKVIISGREIAVEVGKKVDVSFYSHGSVDRNGNCETEDFVSGGAYFEHSYERTFIEIHVDKIRGSHDTQTGEVTFNNGVRAPFNDEVLRDAFVGTIVWDAKEPNCSATVSQIYLGKAEVHYHRATLEGNGKGSALHAALSDHDPLNAVVMVKSGSQFAGLVLQQPLHLCDRRCYSTHIQGIAVCLLRDQEQPLPRTAFKSSFQQDQVGLQTQLSHLHISTNMRMYDRFELVQNDLCSLERTVLHTKLQALSGASNDYSLVDILGKGHHVFSMGTVAYVASCIAVEAQKADFQNCTKEIPVRVGNKTRFADPFTYILTDFPTVLPCSDLTPVRWYIAGKWYCATPKTQECRAPEKLNLTVHTYEPLGDLTEGLGKDIYSDSQKDQHLALMRTLQARDPILNSGANQAVIGATYDSAGVLRLGPTLSEMDISNLHDLFLGYLFPWIPKVASIWHWITGLILVVAILKLIIGGVLRVYTIYRERGMGWWVVGALWGTAFTILRTPFTIAQAAVDAAVAPLDDHPDQDGPGGHGGAGQGVAVMGLAPGAAVVKPLPPAYQADPVKPAASAYAAARGPDLNSDLPDSDIRLPGAPRRHHHATAPSAASFPRNSTRGSLMIPDMPPQMELLPRLPRQSATAADEAKAEAAAARAAARGAAERAKSCQAAGPKREEEGRQGAAAALSDDDESPKVGPGEEEQSRQAFIRFCTGGSRVEYE